MKTEQTTIGQGHSPEVTKIINKLAEAVRVLDSEPHGGFARVRGGFALDKVIRKAAKMAGVDFTPKFGSWGEEYDRIEALLTEGFFADKERVCNYNVQHITGTARPLGGVQVKICPGGLWANRGGDKLAVFLQNERRKET